MSSFNMRGLTVYITDIRAAANKEAEKKRVDKELAHIRERFKKDKNMDGYNRKKYVCKLLYTHILGYDVEFGHIEAIKLLSAKKFSEKQIGYMAIGVLLSETDDVVRLIIESIRNDLTAHNEIFQCLALGSISTLGGKEMAEALASDVQKLLVSGVAVNYVRKRAALTLLRLYRKYPEMLSAEQWSDRIIQLLDDFDLGVVTSVLSLLLGVVSKEKAGFEGVVRKAIFLLNKLVINREYAADYVYYGVASPWVQVKALRLLQYFPPAEDSTVKQRIRDVLKKILDGAPDPSRPPKNANHANAQYAVLFEAISLLIHMNSDSDLINKAGRLLGEYLNQKQTNIRYLGLDAMTKMATLDEALPTLKKHQRTIINSLKDSDISIRRRALDVLYEMCDATNSKEIVHELLGYLVVSDYAIRGDLVLKIAILAERYATELSWYVDVVLQLIGLAGDFVSDDIWYRVVQIVTNNEDLQAYAAKTVFSSLKREDAHQQAIKVGGYVLGEFGHLISEQEGSSAAEQLAVLKKKMSEVDSVGKAILLSSFVKFANVYPELKGEVVALLEGNASYLDAEVQQRACEYLALTKDDNSLLATVWEVMPQFPERESSVMRRIKDQQSLAADRSAWEGGGHSRHKREHIRDAVGTETPPMSPAMAQHAEGGGAGASGSSAAAATAIAGTGEKPDLMGDLIGGDPVPSAPAPASSGGGTIEGGGVLDELKNLGIDAPLPSSNPPPVALAPSGGVASGGDLALAPEVSSSGVPPATIKAWFNHLLLNGSGVLYEDVNVQVGLKTEWAGPQGRIMLFFGNKSAGPLTNFRSAMSPVPYLMHSASQVQPQVAPKTQVQQQIQVQAKSEFGEPPQLALGFTTDAGVPFNIALRLPVVPSKFTKPRPQDGPSFFGTWQSITGPPLAEQVVFKSGRTVDLANVTRVFVGLGLANLQGLDPSPLNAVGAGTFSCAGGEIEVQTRVEANTNAQMYRLTVKSRSAALSAFFKTAIQALLESTV